MSDSKPSLCYPVLTPLKFRGVVVKPPALIQMGADEARQYQDAGVLGGEDVACLPPGDGEGSTREYPEGAEGGDTDAAAPLPATERAPSAGAPAKGAAKRKKSAK